MFKYFNGITIFTFFNTLLPPTAVGSPKTLDLHLNDNELFVETLSGFPTSVTWDSSLLNCHKPPDVP